MSGRSPTAQHGGSAHLNQLPPTCPHIDRHASQSSATYPYCSYCLPPTSNAMSDFTRSESRGHPKDLNPIYRDHTMSHDNSCHTERTGQKSSLAHSSRHSQGLHLNATNDQPSSVSMEQSPPLYRSLDAWSSAPLTEDPWTAMTAFSRPQVEKDRDEEMQNENMANEPDGQRKGPGSPTQARSG